MHLDEILNMINDLDCIHLNFSDLRNLFLGANQISEIPSEIKAFKRLKVLYLGGNSLTQLPAEICELQRLQALILAQNELKSLLLARENSNVMSCCAFPLKLLRGDS